MRRQLGEKGRGLDKYSRAEAIFTICGVYWLCNENRNVREDRDSSVSSKRTSCEVCDGFVRKGTK